MSIVTNIKKFLGFADGSGKGKFHNEIIINVESLETRIAFLEDGQLEDFEVERTNEERIVGSIFKGRIQNLEDGLQAAFVDIGLKKNAFIHYWDMIPEDAARLEEEEGIQRAIKKKKFEPGEMARRFPPGSEIVVQVSKGPIGTKGPRVTANLSIPGRYLVMMPGTRLKGVSRKVDDPKERARLKKILSRLTTPEELGFIIRTAGAGAKGTSFARDMRVLLETWNQIDKGIRENPAPCKLYDEPGLLERVIRDSVTEDVGRIIIDNKEAYERIRDLIAQVSKRSRRNIKLYDGDAPIFEHFDIERQLDNAIRRKVWLPGGGYLIFDETEALVAIDINTGRHKGGKNQEESILQVNCEAAREIARQLKLRNVGGLVVIDFIDMKSRKHRQHVYKVLKDAVRQDKARTNLLPISELGLLEMTRQRQKESFHSQSHMDCPYCRGRGNVKSALSMSVDIQRHLAEVMRKVRSSKTDVQKLRIAVHPLILDRLRSADEELLLNMESRFGVNMVFQADTGLHVEEFLIINPTNSEVLYSNVEGLRAGEASGVPESSSSSAE